MSDEPRDDADGTEKAGSQDATDFGMKDPTDTDHPTGSQQAQENEATESPS